MTDIKKQKTLFNQAVHLMIEKMVLDQDLKQLKEDFTYHKQHNTDGMDKNTVKLVMKAASLQAKEKFEEFSGDAKALMDLYQVLVD